MRRKCINCGKIFEDEYKYINEYNARVYCNECVRKLWKNKRYL